MGKGAVPELLDYRYLKVANIRAHTSIDFTRVANWYTKIGKQKLC